MDKKFLLNTSLTTGYGNNKTQKTIILDDFPKVMSLITRKISFKKIKYNLKIKKNNNLRCYQHKMERYIHFSPPLGTTTI